MTITLSNETVVEVAPPVVPVIETAPPVTVAVLALPIAGPPGQGQVGPAGPSGPAGPAGPDGSGFYLEQTFATAATAWVVPHNKNTFAVDIDTIDSFGTEIEGDVSRPDRNTIRVDFFRAKTGTARVSGIANA